MKKKTKYRKSVAERGEKTMEQILSAGLEAFAQCGPEGVTTRQLSKAAGVNISAISYYFGGKDEYYIEVVKYLLNKRINKVMDLLSDSMNELNNSERTPQIAVSMLYKVMRTYAAQILTNPDIRFMTNISSREYIHPTAALNILYEKSFLPIHNVISELVACATGASADSPDVAVRAHAIIGQIIIFQVGAAAICRRLGWDKINKKRAEHIAEILADMACKSIGL